MFNATPALRPIKAVQGASRQSATLSSMIRTLGALPEPPALLLAWDATRPATCVPWEVPASTGLVPAWHLHLVVACVIGLGAQRPLTAQMLSGH